MSWLEVAHLGQLAVNKSDLLSFPSMATTAINWEQLLLSLSSKILGVRQVNGNPRAPLILAPGQEQRARDKVQLDELRGSPEHCSLEVSSFA